MQGEGLGAEFLFPKHHTVLFGGHGVCLLLPGHIDSVRVAVAFGEGGLGGRTSVSLKVFGGILKASFGFLSGKHISACQKVFFWMYRKVPSGLCFARRVSVREDAPPLLCPFQGEFVPLILGGWATRRLIFFFFLISKARGNS